MCDLGFGKNFPFGQQSNYELINIINNDNMKALENLPSYDIVSKFSRSTGRSINSTVLLFFNEEGSRTNDYLTLLQWFLLIEQEANLQLIVVEPTLHFNSSKCCCKVQRTFKQVIMELVQYKVFYFMAAYCDFNAINCGKVVPYHLQGMSTNSYFHN